jgi:hypothetical protein
MTALHTVGCSNTTLEWPIPPDIGDAPAVKNRDLKAEHLHVQDPHPVLRAYVKLYRQEIIDEFTTTLREIHRALKPEGLFINMFPAKEVWREGHIGVPFIHWFPKKSKARLSYATITESLGIAYH